MRAEILCVGSELLLGQIIDTNAAYMAGELSRIGVDMHHKQTVGDNLDRIADCIRAALDRADVLVITGGLGPTTDDLTREAIAVALGVELEHHDELETGLREFFASRGINISPTIMRQAYLPAGAKALPNSNGTAPGVYATTLDGKMIFAVPGVPREMKAMLQLSVIPAILEKSEGQRQIIVSRVLRTTGIGESMLAEPIEDILTSATNPTAAPLLFGHTEVHLRLTAKAPDEATARTLLDGLETQIRERVGEHIFAVDDETIAAVVLRLLRERGATLAVAESLTGGLINSMLTDVAGASDVLRGGVVAYNSEIKTTVLAVPQNTIDAHGVVSAETAMAMARGAAQSCDAKFALATTGEAGPNSGSIAPVGKVFVAICDREADFAQSYEMDFRGDRDIIRRRASMAALNTLRRYLLEKYS